jgi:catalase
LLVAYAWHDTHAHAGIHSLLEDAAVVAGGTCHSCHTKDLYEAIAAGDYPEWTLAIQTMDLADEDKYVLLVGWGG